MKKTIPRLTVVYGGQFGSEGKGQVLTAIIRDERKEFGTDFTAVRVGGPNAGHTIRGASGKIIKVQSIPAPAFVFPECIPVIGAGGLVNRLVLDRELEVLRAERVHMDWPRARWAKVHLDPSAMVVTASHIETERFWLMQEGIGSTCEGVGAALAEKIQRHGGRVVRDYANWPSDVIVTDTVRGMNALYIPIYVEATQGYRLGIHTSGFYPFTTSRECGPEGTLADIGLTPRSAKEVELVCVLRTFPIRVAGNSGELKNELTWEDMKARCGIQVPERTTVTNRIRRIAEWDMDAVKQTIRETRPTCLAISFIDYLFPETAGAREQRHLSPEATHWLAWVQEEAGTPIRYVSAGQGQDRTFRVSVPQIGGIT